MTSRRRTSADLGGFGPHPLPPPSKPLPSVRLKRAEPTAAGGTFGGLSTSRSARNRRFRTSLVTTGRLPRRRRGRQVVGGGARSPVAQAPRGFVVGGVSRTITSLLRSAGAALRPPRQGCPPFRPKNSSGMTIFWAPGRVLGGGGRRPFPGVDATSQQRWQVCTASDLDQGSLGLVGTLKEQVVLSLKKGGLA
jgi:hypothetical protein